MRRQSTRATITPWTFENEYQWGDFHGDAKGMLRRGYDIHLHYANFGTRTLLIRLPGGLPDPKAAAPYLNAESVQFRKDRKGNNGTLVIDPYYEAGELDEIWDVGELFGRLVSVRAELLDGDLRPLYLAHLAARHDSCQDQETTREAPVPAGIGSLTSGQAALAEFYGISDSLIEAAAKISEKPC